MEDWLAAQSSAQTVTTYRWALDEYTRWCDRNEVDVLGARRADVDRFRQWLRNPSRPGGVCSETTVAKKLSALSSFYSYAVLETELEHSPVANVRRPRVANTTTREGLTVVEAQALLAASIADGPMPAALVHVLLSTGVRVSEACSADVRHLGHDRGQRTLSVVRKGGKKDRLPVPPPYIDVLDAYLAGRVDGALLQTSRGRLSRQEAYRIVSRLAAKVAPEKTIGPHSLRHTAATLAIDGGAPIWRVQQMLGHADIRTTMRYHHASGSLDDSAVHILAAALQRKT